MELWTPLEAKSTLFETSAFRVTVILFGSIALTFASVNIINSRTPDAPVLSETFFKYLFTTLSQPALIAGLSLPILGLIASHLRSIQTKVQIETQEEQNIFSNYSKHREFFQDLFKTEGLFSGDSGFSGKAHELHAILYPRAQNGLLGASPENTRGINKLLESSKRIESLCRETTWNSQGRPEDLGNEVEAHISLLCSIFKLRESFFVQHTKTEDLPAMQTRLQRLSVAQQHLATAATFIMVNECSEKFVEMHTTIDSAEYWIRRVQTERNLLEQVVELVERRQTQIQEMSEYLRSNLIMFLARETDEKFRVIEGQIRQFDDYESTLDELKIMVKNESVNNADYISRPPQDDQASNVQTASS